MSAGSYQPTMDPDQYAEMFRNVNPLTQQLMPQLQQGLGQSMNFLSNFDPSAFMNQFLNFAPALQGLTTSATSDLAQQQRQSLGQLTGQAISQVGNELSKLGGVNSSAYARMVGEAMAPTIGQYATELSGQRIGLMNTLGGGAMGALSQGNMAGLQAGSQGLASMAALASPDMQAPDLYYQPSAWETYGMPIFEQGLSMLPLLFI